MYREPDDVEEPADFEEPTTKNLRLPMQREDDLTEPTSGIAIHEGWPILTTTIPWKMEYLDRLRVEPISGIGSQRKTYSDTMNLTNHWKKKQPMLSSRKITNWQWKLNNCIMKTSVYYSNDGIFGASINNDGDDDMTKWPMAVVTLCIENNDHNGNINIERKYNDHVIYVNERWWW